VSRRQREGQPHPVVAPATPTPTGFQWPHVQQLQVLVVLAGVFAGLILSYADVRGLATSARGEAVTARAEIAELRSELRELRNQVANQIDRVDRNVGYLCQARASDDVESGRPPQQPGCREP
jgi:hypothetical protein